MMKSKIFVSKYFDKTKISFGLFRLYASKSTKVEINKCWTYNL